MMNKCFIIAGGYFDGFFDQINDEDIVIAADRGYDHAVKFGIKVDFIIGDFDSTAKPNLDGVIKLNPIKDFTDTKAAMELGREKGYKEIIIYGGLGGRESHTIANIRSALEYKKLGVDVVLKSRYKEMRIVSSNFSYKFNQAQGDFYVSIFALSNEVRGLSIKGLFYELEAYTMTMDDSLGVSNETTGRDFSINIEEGYVLVIFESKAI